jgi:hypothetical protein
VRATAQLALRFGLRKEVIAFAVQKYADKKSLINEIRKTADMFIRESGDLEEADKDNAVPVRG